MNEYLKLENTNTSCVTLFAKSCLYLPFHWTVQHEKAETAKHVKKLTSRYLHEWVIRASNLEIESKIYFQLNELTLYCCSLFNFLLSAD